MSANLPYRRADRVADNLFRELGLVLLSAVKDPRVQGVTITGAEMSNDLKHALVFFSTMPGSAGPEEAQRGLTRAARFMAHEAARRLELKFVPELLFKFDPAIERGAKINEMLHQLAESATPREENNDPKEDDE